MMNTDKTFTTRRGSRLIGRECAWQATLALAVTWLASGACTAAGSAQAGMDAASSVSPALQEARRHMLDGSINALTFHSMDQLFYTRKVARSGPVWQLSSRDTPLSFTYSFDGKSYASADFIERTDTNALIILKHGVIVYEDYRNLTNQGTAFVSFSMAKSITSMLIGVALAEGQIKSVDDPMTKYIPELKGSGYEGVTIRQVMQMRSGVHYDERYDFGAKSQAQQVFEEAIVQNVKRFADMAPTLKRGMAPGARFNYSTMDTAVLGWMLERAVKQPLSTYMTAKLWEPMGAEADGFWMADGPPGVGRALNGMGFNAVARDYARIGQLMLQSGNLHGTQIIPRDWIALSTASTAIDGPKPPGVMPVELGYGYQWWTLHGTGAYTALGLQGQFIYVDPLTETVVVKLSYFPPDDRGALEAESLTFFRAVSAWKP
jgi:CubicO group peptidase (beta-lactamase class C family)